MSQGATTTDPRHRVAAFVASARADPTDLATVSVWSMTPADLPDADVVTETETVLLTYATDHDAKALRVLGRRVLALSTWVVAFTSASFRPSVEIEGHCTLVVCDQIATGLAATEAPRGSFQTWCD